MNPKYTSVAAAALALALVGGQAEAEILAMVNYESKTEESLKALGLSGSMQREEGLAVLVGRNLRAPGPEPGQYSNATAARRPALRSVFQN